MQFTIKRESKGMKVLTEKIASYSKIKGVQAGWFGDKRYAPKVTYDSKGRQHQSKEMPPKVKNVAYEQDTGTYTHPKKPRPILKPTLKKNEKKWAEMMSQTIQKNLDSKFTNENELIKDLSLLGARMEADIKKEIKSIVSPPLAPATIEARKRTLKETALGGSITTSFTKPLIETGTMLTSVTNRVILK